MSIDPRVFASQNQLGAHLMAILKDQRQPDRLRVAKPMIRRLLQTKQPIPPDLPQLLLNTLDKAVRSGKTSFQQSMDHFLSCLSVVIEESGSKLSDLTYRLFYQILLLPLETKDRKQITNDKIYLQIYDNVRMDKNDETQRRFLILIKVILKLKQLILDIVVETNPSDTNKLFNLVKKAGQKYQNQQIVNVIFSFYVARIQAALLSQQQSAIIIRSLSEMSKIIALKYRSQTTQVINKAILMIVDGNGGSILPGFCVYLLLEASKKELINYYTLILSDDKGFGGRLATRLRQTAEKLGDVLVDVSLFDLPVTDKRPKIRLQQLLLILLANLIAKTYQSPQTLEQFFRRASFFCRQANTNFQDIIGAIVLMTYLQSLQFTCGKDIEINKLNMSSMNYVLVYFFTRKSESFLFNFLNILVQNKMQFSTIMDELGLLSQHRIIMEYLSNTQASIDPRVLYVLIQYFNSTTSYELCDKTKLLLYKTLCKLDRIDQLINNFKDQRISVKILQIQHTNILRIQKLVLDKYFDADTHFQFTVKFFSSISVGDTLMSSLADLLFQRVMSLDSAVTTTPIKKSPGFLDISYLLLQQINLTVLDDLGQLTTIEHPWIQKSLKLLLALKPSASALKRIISLRLDRPSQYTIRKDIIPNRFFLKCIQLGDMKNLMKNILEVVSRVEDPDFSLRIIFDEMPKEVRARYMRYLTTKNVAEFRVFLLDYPEYMHLAE